MPGTAGTLPERDGNAVKGDHGHVLVVGGSDRYTNTPGIVALGALRVGTDLVTAAAPGRSADATATAALNITSEPLDGPRLAAEHVDTVVELAGERDCLAIGPGLGRADATQAAVIDVLDRYDGPAVVDADAIHAAAGAPDVLEGCIVTPHAGEFAALTGEEPGDAVDDRADAAARAADDLDCTVLLKGPVDIVADGDRTERVDAGNPHMARGGTGDVLTGIAAGLVAQGRDPFPAAVTAAGLNGAAGDRALAAHGPGFLLEEMLDAVAAALSDGEPE
ncbi:MAG: NAD(P)H-hydrate dehydratase [Candidatus Nanohaloarchaea archaeon]|nr:NAD(P)H-hydrate dehydratase [Candidatus Nanohaloarchaea archaeon]